MKYLIQTTLAFCVLFTPVYFAGAQDPSWIFNVVNSLLGGVLPLIITFLSALAVLYFVWGMVVFIAQSGNEQARAEGRQRMIWGIVALFVLVSVWGIVVILQTLVGVNGVNVTPTAPQTAYLILQDNYYL